MFFGSKSIVPSVLGHCLQVQPLNLSRRLSIYSLVGLSLLYASAYFLPLLMPIGAFFLPSYDYLGLVCWPSLIAVGVGVCVLQVVAAAVRRWIGPRVATVLAVAALCVFALIALKGIADAAGYDWSDRIPHLGKLAPSYRTIKLIAAIVVFVLVWMARGSIPKMTRALASLGFAFLALAAVRLSILTHAPTVGDYGQGPVAAGSLAPLAPKLATADALPRRVVWVIFDETDFQRVFGVQRAPQLHLPNFERLASISLFAARANSPASATLFSLPALLTGTPLGGAGVRFDTYGRLTLQRTAGGWLPFDEATSIFGAVSAGGRGVSVLGFLHPYCKIFATQRCESVHWPRVGALDDALLANIPDVLSNRLGHPNSWEAMTEHILQVLPEYLVRDDALTFVHIDLPHPPSDYADKALHLQPSSDPLVSYSHNLMLTDRVLGNILSIMQEQSARHELLLVVSSDHWLRNSWYRPNVPESSSPVPMMIWRVGDTKGTLLSEPLSTIHTANMVLSFLKGEISTQADIARWWSNKPVYPTFIGPGT